jgi:hypothetical protein
MEEQKIFKYEIGDRTYFQKPLVYGQIRQLEKLLKGVQFPGEITKSAIIGMFGDKILQAIAIVLHEENKPLRDKDIEALATQLEFDILPEQIFGVMEDFFDCNPIASLSAKLTGTMEKITLKIKETTSKISSASSHPEILQEETKSSGDILPESASPILDPESAK